eukprot:9162344-Heterocapsa_arctica.AAC.1
MRAAAAGSERLRRLTQRLPSARRQGRGGAEQPGRTAIVAEAVMAASPRRGARHRRLVAGRASGA